jgi:hypothetical protein
MRLRNHQRTRRWLLPSLLRLGRLFEVSDEVRVEELHPNVKV